eukprot:scaffold263247_cov27-Tisochrysis_lutea.AAC.1
MPYFLQNCASGTGPGGSQTGLVHARSGPSTAAPARSPRLIHRPCLDQALPCLLHPIATSFGRSP